MIRFHITEDLAKSLTWAEYEALEMAQDGEVKLHRLRPLLARFVVDEENNPVALPSAMKAIASVPMDQVPVIIKGFFEAVKDKAIPKESGLSSSLESTKAEESPDGVAP